MSKPRLLLADDHELFLEGLRKLLAPNFDLVGAVMDGRAAVTAFQQLQPDLLLLDVGIPLLNGIEVARQVKQAAPSAKILFVTMQTDLVYVEEAFRAGATGYLLKQAAARELVEAISTVLNGRRYLSPLIASRKAMMIPVDSDDNRNAAPRDPLTPRQREVLQLVAEGKSMKDIAAVLKISVRTVEFHKNALMETLGLRTTAELTRYALDHHISVRLEE